MPNAHVQAAAAGLAAVTRRETHCMIATESTVAAGALTANAATVPPSPMAAAIERHKAAWIVWEVAHKAWDRAPATELSAETADAYDKAVIDEDAAFDDLLRVRPVSLEEAVMRCHYIPTARGVGECLYENEILIFLRSFDLE